ncbi:hypothetical protein EG827_05615 [bacterium]|jgi:hypothetical protein|nr:hypothetical protein [bacterium]
MSRTIIAVALLLTLLLSCEDSLVPDCGECSATSPETATLTISFRNPDYVPTNPKVTLYEGAIEDSIILVQYIIEDPYSYVSFDALLYKDYTATLEFILDGRTYITTDGAFPQVGYDETSCDSPCYFVFDNNLDLRLRYN